MNTREQLNQYLRGLETRLRWMTVSKGAAVAAGVALGATIALVLITNALAFSSASMAVARVVLFLALALSLGFALVIALTRFDGPPQSRSDRDGAAHRIPGAAGEAARALQERLQVGRSAHGAARKRDGLRISVRLAAGAGRVLRRSLGCPLQDLPDRRGRSAQHQ